jgi:SAM-dependent methyltransferase
MKKETAKNLLDLVKQNYEEIAADFDVTRRKALWPEIKNLAAAVKPGLRVLDAGCGNGRLLGAFKNKPIEYLGVDSSEKLIKAARKNYPDNKFVVGDILKLDAIPDDNFDYIFCLAVLQHIPSEKLRRRALEEMRNKLSPDGQIIISVWNLWSSVWGKKRYRRLIFKNWLLKLGRKNRLDFGDMIFPWKNSLGEETSARYYHAFIKREFKRLARRSGLKFVQLKKDKFNYWLILK